MLELKEDGIGGKLFLGRKVFIPRETMFSVLMKSSPSANIAREKFRLTGPSSSSSEFLGGPSGGLSAGSKGGVKSLDRGLIPKSG